MRRASFLNGFSVVILGVSLMGCTLESFVPKAGDRTDVQDRQQGLSREDFDDLNSKEKLLEQKPIVKAELGAPPIPDIAQVIAAPSAPKIGNSKLVSLAVTDDVPLRDVLFELGRLANVDIEVGAGLDKKGINLRATDRPFNEVIERIANLAHLRYSIENHVIRVEKDTPYIKNYPLDFLNIERSSTSTYSLSTAATSSGGGSSGGSSESGGESSSSSGGESGGSGGGSVATSGSTGSIAAESKSDLWTGLESSIQEILSVSGGSSKSSAQGASGSSSSQEAQFVINRQSGILSVTASSRQHEMIQRFLDLMQRNTSAQVLIEAKVVEVSLNNEYQSGINWNEVLGNAGTGIGLGSYGAGATSNLSEVSSMPSRVTSSSGVFTWGMNNGSLEAIMNMTERYGTTRTLSSPRLAAINNQASVLTFATNRVYFSCTITEGSTSTTSTDGGASETGPSVTCNQNTVPLGIVMTILPSINLKNQEVTLSVRPTLTREVDSVSDPSVPIAGKAAGLTTEEIASIPSTVPVVEVREIDSIMKVKSGGVMVIGGLMEDKTTSIQQGVPGAKDVPFFGNLFKSRAEDMSKRELIIFIKATIVNSDGNAVSVDRAVYEKYTTDPRPLFEGQDAAPDRGQTF